MIGTRSHTPLIALYGMGSQTRTKFHNLHILPSIYAYKGRVQQAQERACVPSEGMDIPGAFNAEIPSDTRVLEEVILVTSSLILDELSIKTLCLPPVYMYSTSPKEVRGITHEK